jgi:hypothetical protein
MSRRRSDSLQNWSEIMTHITAAQSADHFVALNLSGTELPKKQLDHHMGLLSAVLKVEPGRPYSENEINEQLQVWVIPFGRSFGLDHVTLRRYLVDEEYLSRDSADGAYELVTGGSLYTEAGGTNRERVWVGSIRLIGQTIAIN